MSLFYWSAKVSIAFLLPSTVGVGMPASAAEAAAALRASSSCLCRCSSIDTRRAWTHKQKTIGSDPKEKTTSCKVSEPSQTTHPTTCTDCHSGSIGNRLCLLGPTPDLHWGQHQTQSRWHQVPSWCLPLRPEWAMRAVRPPDWVLVGLWPGGILCPPFHLKCLWMLWASLCSPPGKNIMQHADAEVWNCSLLHYKNTNKS